MGQVVGDQGSKALCAQDDRVWGRRGRRPPRERTSDPQAKWRRGRRGGVGGDVGVPSSDGQWGHSGAAPEAETRGEFRFGGELFANLPGHCGPAPAGTGLGPHACPRAHRGEDGRGGGGGQPAGKDRRGGALRGGGWDAGRPPAFALQKHGPPFRSQGVHASPGRAQGFGEGRQNPRAEMLSYGFVLMASFLCLRKFSMPHTGPKNKPENTEKREGDREAHPQCPGSQGIVTNPLVHGTL